MGDGLEKLDHLTRFDFPNGERMWVADAPSLPWPSSTETEVYYGGRKIVKKPGFHSLWIMEGRIAPNIKTHIDNIIREYNRLYRTCTDIECERLMLGRNKSS